MSNTTKKQPMSVVKKMMIALVGGLFIVAQLSRQKSKIFIMN